MPQTNRPDARTAASDSDGKQVRGNELQGDSGQKRNHDNTGRQRIAQGSEYVTALSERLSDDPCHFIPEHKALGKRALSSQRSGLRRLAHPPDPERLSDTRLFRRMYCRTFACNLILDFGMQPRSGVPAGTSGPAGNRRQPPPPKPADRLNTKSRSPDGLIVPNVAKTATYRQKKETIFCFFHSFGYFYIWYIFFRI